MCVGRLGLVAMVAVACSRHVTFGPTGHLALEGTRVYAVAGLRGDTLVVDVSLRNMTREQGWVELNACGPAVFVRVTSLAGRGGAWDSESWRVGPAAQRVMPSPVNPDWRPSPNRTCTGGSWRQTLAPGDSAHVASITIATDAILGDSLPAGRYRVSARYWGVPKSWLATGEVELRPPR